MEEGVYKSRGYSLLIFAQPIALLKYIYFILHSAWLLWHFNRQNWGIFRIFSGMKSIGPSNRVETAAFMALPVGPILIIMSLRPEMSPLTESYSLLLVALGTLVFIVSACALLVAQPMQGRSISQMPVWWIVLSILFFVPPVLSNTPSIAITFYAHPLQYIIMMSILAANRGSEAGLPSAPGRLARIGGRMVLLITLGLGFYFGLTALRGGYAGPDDGSWIYLGIMYGIDLL